MAKASQSIGQRLKAMRAKRRLTMRELSAGSGVHPSVISLIENGKRDPNLRHLQGLASALHCSVHDLIPFRAP